MTVEHNSLSPEARITSAAKRENHGGNGTTGITESWPHFNHIGNIQCFSNEEGVKTLALESDAWGNRIGNMSTGASISVDGARSITSKKYDADVEFYYFYQRWFLPVEGRFLSQEPLKEDGFNLYHFNHNDPMNRYDPDGLESKSHHRPGGPYHPPGGVKTKCTKEDTCSALKGKLFLLGRMIRSHTGHDNMRTPGRHRIEIGDLLRAWGKCAAILQQMCKEDPEPIWPRCIWKPKTEDLKPLILVPLIPLIPLIPRAPLRPISPRPRPNPLPYDYPPAFA